MSCEDFVIKRTFWVRYKIVYLMLACSSARDFDDRFAMYCPALVRGSGKCTSVCSRVVKCPSEKVESTATRLAMISSHLGPCDLCHFDFSVCVRPRCGVLPVMRSTPTSVVSSNPARFESLALYKSASSSSGRGMAEASSISFWY